MKITKLRINNLASFIEFENDSDFKKTNLLFGTNGAGKSTLGNLLLLLDDFKRKKGDDSEQKLKDFFHGRISKEAKSSEIVVEIVFENGTERIIYDNGSDSVRCSNTVWNPIRVFNDEYTLRTIGETVQLDLESGIIIGEANIELSKAITTVQSLIEEHKKCVQKAEETVQTAIKSYRDITDSTANVDAIISAKTALDPKCEFSQDPSLVDQRKLLGYSKPQVSVAKIDSEQVKLRMNIDTLESKCKEVVLAPTVSGDAAAMLKEYTDFFKNGVELFDLGKINLCPFCRRDWPDNEILIEQYRSYLKSAYNKKRGDITDIKASLQRYKEQVLGQVDSVERIRKATALEASKYRIDMASWKPLSYDQDNHDRIFKILEEKYNNMEKPVSISENLIKLQLSHVDCVNSNNAIIGAIQGEIDAITTRRKTLNKNLAEHFAACAWADCKDSRNTINDLDKRIGDLNKRIEQLETDSPPQDTVRTVFNNLIYLMGLGEYSIDADRHLTITIEQNYDISNEGQRISSAQRKCLSLCYYFAEVVSELKNLKELKNYILVFDDPVDSADYVFFFSIATIIENVEAILSKILNSKAVKLGQLFVLTHNSLLHDRLFSKWAEDKKTIRKQASISILSSAEKSINNYNEYIREICKYYTNPVSQKRRMIYIGNLIRRVLEIIASFDSLGSNDISKLLDGMGQPKLGMIANFLSHESFTRVLNPISEPVELRDACKELLDVIKQRHPAQYESIIKRYGVEEIKQQEAS